MQIPLFTDPVLVDRLRMGDEQAFQLIFEKFHRKIYQFAFHILKEKEQSEEIVQETFLSFWLHKEKLDRIRPIEPYIYTIARRTITDHWRKSATAKSFREELYRKIEYSRNDVEEKLILKDLERIMKEGFIQLTPQQLIAFKMSRYEGRSYEEIADIMGISKNTVKYHLVNALKLLRSHFHQNDVTYVFFLFILY